MADVPSDGRWLRKWDRQPLAEWARFCLYVDAAPNSRCAAGGSPRDADQLCHDSGMIAVAAGSLVTAPHGGIDRIYADGRLHTDAGHPVAPVDGRSNLRQVDATHFRPLPDRRWFEDSAQRPARLQQRDLEVVDIRTGGEWPIWILSNLTPNAFVFAGLAAASMEGFLQSLKYEDPAEAALVRKLAGRKAKRAGKKRREAWQRSKTLWIEGRTIDRFGSRYQQLLDGAYAALVSQCEEAPRLAGNERRRVAPHDR